MQFMKLAELEASLYHQANSQMYSFAHDVLALSLVSNGLA